MSPLHWLQSPIEWGFACEDMMALQKQEPPVELKDMMLNKFHDLFKIQAAQDEADIGLRDILSWNEFYTWINASHPLTN